MNREFFKIMELENMVLYTGYSSAMHSINNNIIQIEYIKKL